MNKIRPDDCMLIPLEPEHYRLLTVGEMTQERHWNAPQGAYRHTQVYRDRNLVAYELTRHAARAIIENVPTRLNSHYTVEHIVGKGVCLRCPDHGFGRGVVRKLLGWEFILSVDNNGDADAAEEMLKGLRVEYVRSRLYGSSYGKSAFSLNNEEALHLVRLSFESGEAKRSRLPFAPLESLSDEEPSPSPESPSNSGGRKTRSPRKKP